MDVITQNRHSAVSRAVDFLIRGGDFVLGFDGAVVDGRRRDEAFGDFWWVEGEVFFWVCGVEEGGVNVVGGFAFGGDGGGGGGGEEGSGEEREEGEFGG